MQINNNQRSGTSKRSVFIDPRPRKESEMLDKAGNVIDPKTKVIIKTAEQNK